MKMKKDHIYTTKIDLGQDMVNIVNMRNDGAHMY